MKNIVTRFAPSPTGMLHIGSVRTALFSYLFARQNNGKFLLRIEDTDKQRSTKEAVDVILSGLKWLGIDWDGDEVYQSSFASDHAKFAMQLVMSGHAYYAYDTKEELEEMKESFAKQGKHFLYKGTKWYDCDVKREGVEPVVRLRVPKEKKIIINDLIKGPVEFDTDSIEDFALLRSDGSPTYMMAVVVDDIDMGVTHVIRGDDHLSNTPKQVLIYQALGASIPEFAHIPLINDMDGKKLSKRRGAVAAEDYKKQGFLPEALVNYLLKLGFSYGDKEFFTKEEMIKYFSLSGIGLAPARFDISKLRHINQFYLKNKSNNDIINLISEDIHIMYSKKLNDIDLSRLEVIMDELKKCSTLNEVTSALGPYLTDFTLCYTEEALQVIKSCGEVLNKLQLFIQSCNFDNFDSEFKAFLATNGFAFKQVGPVLRSVLIGKTDSTAISLIVKTLGKDEVKKRVLGFCLS